MTINLKREFNNQVMQIKIPQNMITEDDSKKITNMKMDTKVSHAHSFSIIVSKKSLSKQRFGREPVPEGKKLCSLYNKKKQ